jgi:hypothetical protein
VTASAGKSAEGATGRLSGDGSRYARLLMPLAVQLERLHHYNRRFWGACLTKEQLAGVDTSSNHVQRVDDLEILHVEFSSPNETVRMWWRAILAVQIRCPRHEDPIFLGTRNLRLAPGAYRYEPGIHRVRINLTALWEPDFGLTIDEARSKAATDAETLCAAEPLSAYGLHHWLLRQVDGKSLPYAQMAGFEYSFKAWIKRSWDRVPALTYHRGGSEVDFCCPPIDRPAYEGAVPILISR